MFLDSNDLLGMVDISKAIMDKYDKDTCIRILDNLKDWINCGGEISVYWLENIALAFKGERSPVKVNYDKEVKRSLLDLYSSAIKYGEYNIELLEAGLRVKRGYKILNNLASYKHYDKSVFDVTPYAMDDKWPDEWIDKLESCADHVRQCKEFGYDLMSVFTSQHSPYAFYEVCHHIKNEEKYRISLEWLKDPHWSSFEARSLVYLYMYKPGTEWSEVIRPWMCSWAISEIDVNSSAKRERHIEIIEKWINVSPLLEYVLCNWVSSERYRDYEYVYDSYSSLRDRYGVDGDELARSLQSFDDIPTDVMNRNAYYIESVKDWREQSQKFAGSPKSVASMFNAATIMGGD